MGLHCAVCLESFSAIWVPYVLSCGHSLCQSCCDMQSTSCPLCNQPLQKLCINEPLMKTVEAVLAAKHQEEAAAAMQTLKASRTNGSLPGRARSAALAAPPVACPRDP
eukprot:GGOE01028455.1.p1 GENE.GGOE01028455.1~~GGOE01028455.1.p1  ORF type:complete len:108 (+),score=13.14 GGOE01028455.1:289-612(+)